MDVARRDDWLFELFAELYDRAVKRVQLLDVADGARAHEEEVVAVGLDFEVIVKARDVQKLVPGFAVEYGAVELAGLAGAADQKALAVAHEFRLRDARLLIKILEMRLRNELVQIFEPCIVLDEDNLVVHLHLFRVAAGEARVDVGDGFGPRILAQALEQLDKNEREHLGVVAGAVVVKIAEL